MYYVELIDRFWLFSKKTKPGTAAISLYLYLLQLAKEKNAYQFVISDINLGKSLGVSRATVRTTREKLRTFGLIDYRSMQGVAGMYRLIVNYPIEETNHDEIKNDVEDPIVLINEDKILLRNKKQNNSGTDETISGRNAASESCTPFRENRMVPDLQEFLQYARTLDAYRSELDDRITAKYSGWLVNDWKSESGRVITNWRTSLKNVLPFLKSGGQDSQVSIDKIPEVRHPKE